MVVARNIHQSSDVSVSCRSADHSNFDGPTAALDGLQASFLAGPWSYQDLSLVVRPYNDFLV